MDAEMAFLMANQAQAKAGRLVYDPFVGTGSILVAAAHYGAITMVSALVLHKRRALIVFLGFLTIIN